MRERSIQFAMAAICVVLVGASTLAHAEDVRYRKHVDDMTAAEWTALSNAIAALHKKDKINPDGSAPFPQSHDSYEWFVQIHGDRREAGGCQHGNELIWSWHRAFLLHFENQLRAANPPESSQLTLPYWNWAEPPSGANGYPAAYENAQSPLFHPRRQYPGKRVPLEVAASGLPQGQTGAQFVSSILAENSWQIFGGSRRGPDQDKGRMESQLHDVIHGYIGRDNATPVRSVRDPIFWAHHSNLDRLWATWQEQHPESQQCFDCERTVYDRSPELGPLKVRDVLDNSSIKGVRVAYLPRSKPDQGVALMAKPTLPAEPGVYPYWFEFPSVDGARFRLRVENLKLPATRSYRVDVYLFPASVKFAATNKDFERQYKATVFANFAMGHGNEDGGHQGHGPEHEAAADVSVDLTTAVKAVPAASKGKKYILALRFVSTEENSSYADIASEVQFDNVQLIRSDFATTEPIPLNK